jgi:hypothetical protein
VKQVASRYVYFYWKIMVIKSEEYQK